MTQPPLPDTGGQRARRARAWLGTTLLAGLAAAIVGFVTDGAAGLRQAVFDSDDPPPPVSAVVTRAPCPSAGRAGFQVVVTGRADTTVVLTGLDVVVDSRATPVAGTTEPTVCAVPIKERVFEADLDATPVAVEVVRAREDRDPVAFPLRLTAADPEVFVVYGATESCDCRWHAELAWVADGRSGVTMIDDHGEPFRTSSL